MKTKYYVYIICSGNSEYIGSTRDLKNRINRHNSGRSKSTKHLKDWKLRYFETYKTLSEARRQETNLKRNKKRQSDKNLQYRDVAQPG